jgi:hypothetical protein
MPTTIQECGRLCHRRSRQGVLRRVTDAFQSDASQAPLFKLASELGATTVSAFTDRVTHLVAESHGGAKYVVRAVYQVADSPETCCSAHWTAKYLSCFRLG